jgi:hypothetical protein
VGLNVRVCHACRAPKEAPGLQVGRGGRAGLVEEPLEAHTDHTQSLLLGVEGDGLGALLGHVQLQMVLQVGPHTRQVVYYLHTNLQWVKVDGTQRGLNSGDQGQVR